MNTEPCAEKGTRPPSAWRGARHVGPHGEPSQKDIRCQEKRSRYRRLVGRANMCVIEASGVDMADAMIDYQKNCSRHRRPRLRKRRISTATGPLTTATTWGRLSPSLPSTASTGPCSTHTNSLSRTPLHEYDGRYEPPNLIAFSALRQNARQPSRETIRHHSRCTSTRMMDDRGVRGTRSGSPRNATIRLTCRRGESERYWDKLRSPTLPSTDGAIDIGLPFPLAKCLNLCTAHQLPNSPIFGCLKTILPPPTATTLLCATGATETARAIRTWNTVAFGRTFQNTPANHSA